MDSPILTESHPHSSGQVRALLDKRVGDAGQSAIGGVACRSSASGMVASISLAASRAGRYWSRNIAA
jgi:hypothetical protein